jgi:hypothetical protein
MIDHYNPSRDIFPIALRCPKCGQTGTAMWEENSHISPDGPEPTLASLSDGFYRRDGEGPAGAPLIVCRQCETPQPE